MTRLLLASLVGASLTLTGALACRQRPMAAGPRDAAFVAAVNLGVAQMGQFDFTGAVTTFAALAETHPDDAGVAVNLALARINRQAEGDAEAAEAVLAPRVDDAAVGRRASYALALLRLYSGRDAEAAALLDRVAAAEPGDPFPAYFAGQARLSSAPADALTRFTTAQTIAPLLRSAYYGGFQALQRLGRPAEADAMLARFQALERDPRAQVAEFKYTRMGPLAMAFTLDPPPVGATLPLPSVPSLAFAAMRPQQFPLPPGVVWKPAAPGAVTAVDIDGDGDVDLFLANVLAGDAPNAVVLNGGDASALDTGHPLSRVRGVRSALWGDIDDDGLVDAVLLGSGTTAIWRQAPAGRWQDATAAMRAATPDIDAVDGALFDADHDGDLDVWLVNGRGGDELLNNDGNGSFRRIAAQAGLAADRRPSRGVAVADLDGDRDHDLIVLKASPPHEAFLNDRVWRYRPASGMASFAAAALEAVVAADSDADGQVELYTSGPRGLERWQPDATGAWNATAIATPSGGPAAAGAGASSATAGPARASRLAVADVDGDGGLDLIASRGDGWAAWPLVGQEPAPIADQSSSAVRAWAVVQRDASRGPSVLGLGDGGLVEWAPGPQRPNYVSIFPTGRQVASDQRRSNISGIGTRVAVRAGSRWTAFDTARTASGPGQSLQPFAVGLGAAARADFVSLVWPDGVLQTEIALDSGRVHRIEETQRQLSSCPVLFSHDGSGFRFVTDILGVGGIGFLERPGVYSAPFPRERVLLPTGAVAVHEGRYRFVIAEPMEELTYLDQASLVTYDIPPGWQMTLDERKAIAGPAPTGAPIFFREERLPTRATNDRGQDVTAELAAADLRAAPPGAVDARFIGRTAAHSVEVRFDRAIDRGPGAPVLMIDGWVEYPYAQTVFAAWQANAPYTAPSLDAQDAAGRWHVVAAEFGYPAGMPRRMTLPLTALPRNTVALRLRTTQEIYWDRVAVIYSEPLPAVVVRELPLAAAVLRESGFAARRTGPQRAPSYDYARRAPLLDTRHPRGWYSRFGAVDALVAEADDAVAIFGPGEDLTLEFRAPEAAIAAGWTRRVVLDTRGWCKDMDLYTKDGETVAPLPGRDTAARHRLHARFNTRYEGGV